MDSFLNISDLSKEMLNNIIFNKVKDIKLDKKIIGCLYEKPSTRTRISFVTAINQLNGYSLDLKYEELNFSRQESLEDTFKAFGCYLDGLVYRTSDHKKLLLAKNLMRKPIINALSQTSHPCQTLADLITLYENFRRLDIEISWFGDMNNVLFSLVEAVNMLDVIKLNIFSDASIINDNNWYLSDKIRLFDKIDHKIVKSSNCIMTDVFVSMNDEDSSRKLNLLRDFQVNKELFAKTSDDCVFMHCLPAKVGTEVTKDVIESSRSIVWKQAYNRLPAQKRLLQCINF